MSVTASYTNKYEWVISASLRSICGSISLPAVTKLDHEELVRRALVTLVATIDILCPYLLRRLRRALFSTRVPNGLVSISSHTTGRERWVGTRVPIPGFSAGFCIAPSHDGRREDGGEVLRMTGPMYT